jgi:hypothetical protein
LLRQAEHGKVIVTDVSLKADLVRAGLNDPFYPMAMVPRGTAASQD